MLRLAEPLSRRQRQRQQRATVVSAGQVCLLNEIQSLTREPVGYASEGASRHAPRGVEANGTEHRERVPARHQQFEGVGAVRASVVQAQTTNIIRPPSTPAEQCAELSADRSPGARTTTTWTWTWTATTVVRRTPLCWLSFGALIVKPFIEGKNPFCCWGYISQQSSRAAGRAAAQSGAQ